MIALMHTDAVRRCKSWKQVRTLSSYFFSLQERLEVMSGTRKFRSRDPRAVLAFMDELSSDGSCSEYEDLEDALFDDNDDGSSLLFVPERRPQFHGPSYGPPVLCKTSPTLFTAKLIITSTLYSEHSLHFFGLCPCYFSCRRVQQ